MWNLILPALTGILGGLGGAGKGAAEERGNQNDFISRNNQALSSLYGTQQGSILSALGLGSREQSDQAGIDLDRRKFALTAPDVRANQSVRGSLMANAKPFRVSGLPSHIRKPTISGGFANAIGPETRELGRVMMAKALQDQMKGDTFDPMEKTDFKGGLLPPPSLQGFQRPGTMETIGSIAGLGGGILGALLPLLQRSQKQDPSLGLWGAG